MEQKSKVFQVVVWKSTTDLGVVTGNNGTTQMTKVVKAEPTAVRLLGIDYVCTDAKQDDLLLVESDQLLNDYGERYCHFVRTRLGGGVVFGNNVNPSFNLPQDGRLGLKVRYHTGSEPNNFSCVFTFAVDF